MGLVNNHLSLEWIPHFLGVKHIYSFVPLLHLTWSVQNGSKRYKLFRSISNLLTFAINLEKLDILVALIFHMIFGFLNFQTPLDLPVYT